MASFVELVSKFQSGAGRNALILKNPSETTLRSVLDAKSRINTVENGFKWGGLPTIELESTMLGAGAKGCHPEKNTLPNIAKVGFADPSAYGTYYIGRLKP